ncbi:DUF3416 domain-containing protein, partial [Candidatus Gracilibacteria bacterium]|nr:DUF3416 domain-containing protein [Candidatus Gracilibacteria bacterium]
MTIDAQSPALLGAGTSNGREVPINVEEGRRRTIVEGVQPQIDGGRYPIKRIVGDTVVVEADCFADGHDVLSCAVLYRQAGASQWQFAPMTFLINDRWRGSFVVDTVGSYEYTVASWIDRFKTWEHAMEKRIAVGQDIRVDLLIGAELVAEA